MKLFEVSWERSNTIDDWTHKELVVAKDMAAVVKKYPHAECIKQKQDSIKILNN